MRFFLLITLLATMNFCANATTISYELNDLGTDSYEYTYSVSNDTLGVPIEEFTIWFDETLYNNLEITTHIHIADNWNEIILPSTGLGVPLGYDALAVGSGIGAATVGLGPGDGHGHRRESGDHRRRREQH